MSSWRTRPGSVGAAIGAAYALASLAVTAAIQARVGHELEPGSRLVIAGIFITVAALHAGFDERRGKR